MDVDNFTGDSVTLVFSRASNNTSENGTIVFIDGVYQEKSEYSVSGSDIVFSSAPYTGNEIEVLSNRNGAFDVDSFTGNGAVVVFERASSEAVENRTQVYLSGVYQTKAQYTVSGRNVIFSIAPGSGESVEVISY
jgi:class 3 adenylate cyclase